MFPEASEPARYFKNKRQEGRMKETRIVENADNEADQGVKPMVGAYRKCEQFELLNKFGSSTDRFGMMNCDGNASKTVNLPGDSGDSSEWHTSHPRSDHVYWVCSEHFSENYHSYIIRGFTEQCDCPVCRAEDNTIPTMTTKLPEQCPGCGMVLDEWGLDVDGNYHLGAGGCAER
jgi:hypothetical protein